MFDSYESCLIFDHLIHMNHINHITSSELHMLYSSLFSPISNCGGLCIIIVSLYRLTISSYRRMIFDHWLASDSFVVIAFVLLLVVGYWLCMRPHSHLSSVSAIQSNHYQYQTSHFLHHSIIESSVISWYQHSISSSLITSLHSSLTQLSLFTSARIVPWSTSIQSLFLLSNQIDHTIIVWHINQSIHSQLSIGQSITGSVNKKISISQLLHITRWIVNGLHERCCLSDQQHDVEPIDERLAIDLSARSVN